MLLVGLLLLVDSGTSTRRMSVCSCVVEPYPVGWDRRGITTEQVPILRTPSLSCDHLKPSSVQSSVR